MKRMDSLASNYSQSLYSEDSSEVASTPEVEDIEKLITLAENIYLTLHRMEYEINLIRQRSFWAVGIGYSIISLLIYMYLFLDKGGYIAFIDLALLGACLLVTITSIIAYFNMRRERLRLHMEIKVEESVLSELLDMIYELDNANSHGLSYDPVSQAIIKIRLRRLKFTF